TLLRRIGLAAAKYWVCKRATPHAAEAMECLGGNGYVEDFGMASVVPARTSDPPCFSVIDMPAVRPVFVVGTASSGS
ncbi:hypothetical protein C6A85_09735, partial [Mycobacterium sp. ITM-2017-0098]